MLTQISKNVNLSFIFTTLSLKTLSANFSFRRKLRIFCTFLNRKEKTRKFPQNQDAQANWLYALCNDYDVNSVNKNEKIALRQN